MDKEILFFDYERCFNHYVKHVDKIRQARVNGEIILAKPALLVSLIDALDDDVFIHNEFFINEWIEERYKEIMSQYAKNSQFATKTGINKPFWHLESDGFWNLICPGDHIHKSHTPSKAWLKDNVEFAYFDESLWILLQNKIWRTQLSDYIIEHKLTDSSWSSTIKVSGLGIFAAFLLSA